MRLQRQLRAIRTQLEKSTSARELAVIDQVVADLKARGVELDALKPGQQAPDFTLPNHLGRAVPLYETLVRGPVVLQFYRGAWCPYCSAQLRAMQLVLPQIHAVGARLIAVSPELPDHSLTLAERNALDFDILSDGGAIVARSYGLVYSVPEPLRDLYRANGLDLGKRNGVAPGEPWLLPVPATYLLSPDGVVRFVDVDADFSRRPEPQIIVELLLARNPDV